MLLLLVAAASCGGGSEHIPILTCEAANGIEPDCRFHNPEDLVIAPAGRRLLVSQMGSLDGSAPGSLVSFEPDTGEIAEVYPNGTVDEGTGPNWGSPDCEPLVDPSVFTPHGIDIEKRDDGRYELFVVNHGGRESIELFEVIEGSTGVTLEYRGCVLAAPNGFHNDIVGFADGSFWVSHMYPRSSKQVLALLRMSFTSYAPGRAYAWKRDTGYREIGGSETKFGNGVEKSEDGRFLFLNNYLGGEVVKIDVAAGKRVGSVNIASPDNLAWSPTGELLVASHQASVSETTACLGLEEGSCGIRFEILAIDPEHMTARSIISNIGAPMGAATVARPFGEHVYLGTFAGDRIARFDLARLDKPGR